jgi:hypothetical protein
MSITALSFYHLAALELHLINLNTTDLDKRDGVIFSPLSLWEKRGSKMMKLMNIHASMPTNRYDE